MSPSWNIFFTITFLFCLYAVNSQPFDYPTATLSSSWINSVTANHSVSFTDTSTVRAILLRGAFGPRYAAGFYCNGTCETYVFAIFIIQTNSGGGITMPSFGFPQVVWSANRSKPVRINATLRLTAEGNLVLRDADGSLAWSTETSGRSVVGMKLTETGNLVLFDAKNSVVWQSFDHPTDALVPEQKLVSGKRLTANGGSYSLSMTEKGLVASRLSKVYYEKVYNGRKKNKEASFAKFENGSLALYVNSVRNADMRIAIPVATSAQYMKLGPDGHLRVFEWLSPWKEVADLLK